MGYMSLWQNILTVLFPPRTTERVVSNVSSDELLALVSPLTHEENGVVSLLPYKNEVVSALVREAKFHDNERATLLLAQVLQEFLLEWSAVRIEPSRIVLVPIPLSKKRSRARGYNQAERVCAHVSKALHYITYRTDIITRTRDTAPQTTLRKKERLLNMRGAFSAQNVSQSETYVVVDDVVTTGATLMDAKRALGEAGATHVVCIALSH